MMKFPEVNIKETMAPDYILRMKKADELIKQLNSASIENNSLQPKTQQKKGGYSKKKKHKKTKKENIKK